MLSRAPWSGLNTYRGERLLHGEVTDLSIDVLVARATLVAAVSDAAQAAGLTPYLVRRWRRPVGDLQIGVALWGITRNDVFLEWFVDEPVVTAVVQSGRDGGLWGGWQAPLVGGSWKDFGWLDPARPWIERQQSVDFALLNDDNAVGAAIEHALSALGHCLSFLSDVGRRTALASLLLDPQRSQRFGVSDPRNKVERQILAGLLLAREGDSNGLDVLRAAAGEPKSYRSPDLEMFARAEAAAVRWLRV